jgi:hypothetical protein
MTRTRKFYAFATPVAVAGLVLPSGCPTHADRDDDDDDDDYIDIDTGDDSNDSGPGHLNISSPWAGSTSTDSTSAPRRSAGTRSRPAAKITFVNKDQGVKERRSSSRPART